METLIEVNDLCRNYANHPVVRGLNFTLKKGEILGLLGVNGAGKSTTMDMLSGNLAMSSGSIQINGFDLRNEPNQAKASLGYLPETPPLYSDLSVDEYLAYVTELRGIPRSDRTQAISLAKSRCQLASVSHQLIGQLSKGYRQRVGIAQAIIHNPKIIILDEPTVGLDPIQIQDIRRLIQELGKNCGIILSTHILPEVQMLCNRVMILHHGKLVFTDALNNTANTDTHNVVVDFETQPTTTELSAISGVKQVSHQSSNQYHLTISDRTASDLLSELSAQAWGLKQFTPYENNLEQVFSDLVSGDAQ